jgi:hypothetical protein
MKTRFTSAYDLERLKLSAFICMHNYRATRNPFYLNRAINQTRLALVLACSH